MEDIVVQAAQVSATSSLSVEDVLRGLGPMPAEALFLGMAADGQPVLINMYNGQVKPYLIQGHAGWGKTHLLKVILRAAGMNNRREIAAIVLTSHVEEWEYLDDLAEIRELTVENLTLALTAAGSRAVSARETQFVLVLVDGWDDIPDDTPVSKLEPLLSTEYGARFVRILTTRSTKPDHRFTCIWDARSPGRFRTWEQADLVDFHVPGL